MIAVYPYEELGHADHGWLNARHHFSFASYYNPKRENFGVLRVVNDDIIKAGSGFDTHPHRDMEIITYIRHGAMTHKDSQGNKGRTAAGDVQVMSAGTGIFHSEYNLESEDTVLYQIWIEPNSKGVKPRWDQMKFPKEPVSNKLNLLVSGNKRQKEALFIHQNASIYGGKLEVGKEIDHSITSQAYVLISAGEVALNGQVLKEGDAAEVIGLKVITIQALTDAEILVLDVPLRNNN